jgi:integrase/recombinase XerD
MTPLRQKVLDDLRLIGRSKQTQAAYICFISRFARHYQRCPSTLGTEHVRQFFLHLRLTGRKPETLKSYHAALRFLYNIVLDRPDVMAGVPKPKVPRRDPLPALTRHDVRSLLNAANIFLDTTFFTLMYGTGLRVAEACALQVGDIDRANHLLHLRHGKGDKARVVPLSDTLLDVFSHYWRHTRPLQPWLFPSPRFIAVGVVHPQHPWFDKPITTRTMGRHFRELRERTGLRRRATPHWLRKAYATHLLEDGVDLRTIQVLLGHARPETTAIYTSVSAKMLTRCPCPLEGLG